MNANNNNIIIRNTVIKAVFIGDEDTGKSSLVSTYFGNEFVQYIYRTIGTEKFEKKLDFEDKSYKIIIYDTPGRERSRHLIRFNLRMVKIIFLVFDMTKKKTFLALDDFLEYIQEYSDNIHKYTFVLIGNKADLHEKWEIKEKDAKKFAQILNAKFFLASAKDEPDKFKIFMDGFFEDYIKRHKDELEQIQANQQQRLIGRPNPNRRRRKHCA